MSANSTNLNAQIAARQPVIDTIEKMVGGNTDFEPADVLALAPYLSMEEAQTIAFARQPSFAVPGTHIRNMFFRAAFGKDRSKDYFLGDSYLCVGNAMFTGKAHEPGGDPEKVRQDVAHIDRAVSYAQTHWPDLLGTSIGRSYIVYKLIDGSSTTGAGQSRVVQTLHVALSATWDHILSTQRLPLTEAIDAKIIVVSHEHAVGFQLAAGSQPDATICVCAQCGAGFKSDKCAFCHTELKGMWNVKPENSNLPLRLETYVSKHMPEHRFVQVIIGATTLSGPERASLGERMDWEVAMKRRRNAAYLRHCPANCLE